MTTKYYSTWFSDYNNTSPFDIVRFKIPERTVFLIKSTYYKYQADRDTGEVILDVYTYADNETQAYNNINESNNLLSFLYRIRIDNNINLSKGPVEREPNFAPIKKGKNLRRIYDVCEKIKLLSDKKNNALCDSLACYVAALHFEYQQFFAESMLTMFRIFESIAYDYFNGVKKGKLHYDISKLGLNFKIKNILDRYIKIPFRESDYEKIGDSLISSAVGKIHNEAFSKIIYMLESFDIDYDLFKVNEMVKMRNDMTHMKGGQYSSNEILECFNTSYKLASEIISKYFFNINYKDAHLDSNIHF